MPADPDDRSNYDKIFGEHAPRTSGQGQLFEGAGHRAEQEPGWLSSSPAMRLLSADVRAFMEAAGQDMPFAPCIPAEAVRDLRAALIDEEVNQELLPALAADDLVGIADACADAIVVILGTALAYGIPLDRVWGEVDRSNRAKIDPVSGTVLKAKNGKVMKPAGWRPPDIEGVLGLAPSAKLVNGGAP